MVQLNTTTTPALLDSIESEIDASFAENPLVPLPFGQSAWTLLSVAEHYHFKATILTPLSDRHAGMFLDNMMNQLTHPLRVCHKKSPRVGIEFDRRMNTELYHAAHAWFEKAESYVNFSSLFPLYRAEQIDLQVVGNTLVPSDLRNKDMSYEAYNRFVAKRNPDNEGDFDAERLVDELRSRTKFSGDAYSVKFDRRLVQLSQETFGAQLKARHILPNGWEFSSFSLQEFRDVFTCLQSLAYGWFAARQLAVKKGAAQDGYKSCVWTPRKGSLVMILSKGTGHPKNKITDILTYLTFGEMGIRDPDVATQPLIDLLNGQYAISPFLLIHTNVERNLCALLNQIPWEKTLYSRLVGEKEKEARNQLEEFLVGMGLDFRHGKIGGTDVDLAIIDRTAKICLCVEIKWFIEPAEIREISARTKEIKKGVEQAKKIRAAFECSDSALLSLLAIDKSYDFLAMVGSENWIGHDEAQDRSVPITKLWHLASEIRNAGGIAPVMAWLRSRGYLPREGKDYRIVQVPVEVGRWRSTWYGIACV